MRGTPGGETPVSKANTKEYDEGYERTFGPSKPIERGRWIWDAAQQKLVKAEDYVPPERAVDAPIMVDRFYENTKATDGTDIGSRAKHRAYMKAHGLAPADDYSPGWYENRRKEMKREADKNRRETVERAFHLIRDGKDPRK